jgi:hypothetical protein
MMLAFGTGWRVAESSILPLSARDCPRADRQDPIAIQNMMISGLIIKDRNNRVYDPDFRV